MKAVRFFAAMMRNVDDKRSSNALHGCVAPRAHNASQFSPSIIRTQDRMGKNKRGSGSSRKPSGSSGVGGAGSFGKWVAWWVRTPFAMAA